MKIYKNGFNTLPMQVEENMKNIELIASIVKDAYKCSTSLLSTDVSVAISDTNANADTIDGWLIDQGANVFKITGGDSTNLLIEYYTCLKGQDGRDGSDDIDDDVIANDKLWSSQKINDKIGLISDKGIYYTFVQPTLVDSQYELNTSDLENPNQYTFQKYNDIIVYIDGDGKVKDLYNCIAVQGDFSKIYLEKIGEISGGKQLYQHNITCSDGTYSHTVRFAITNDDNTTYNTYSQIISLLNNKGYVLTATDISNEVIDKLKMATGKNGTGTGDSITGVGVQENINNSLVFAKVGASLQVVDISTWNVKDNKEEL